MGKTRKIFLEGRKVRGMKSTNGELKRNVTFG